jgi:phosphoribosylanthranilate isomerase
MRIRDVAGPLIKICGITNFEDAALALELAPDAVAAILSRLRAEGALVPGSAEAVGVFVNEDPDAMADIVSLAALDRAQIHGDETPEACARFGFPWYRALRAATDDEAEGLAGLGWACPRLLFDTAVGGSYGGSGKSMPATVAMAARDAARGAGKEFFLAGGIGPGNVAALILEIGPDGIDVGSGVEERPGKKSRAALERLFAEIGRARGEDGRKRMTK